MAYDQHWGTGDAGPTAGQEWFEHELEQRMVELDPTRTVLALGDYGYDWTLPDGQNKGSAEAVTFNEATQKAHDAGAQPVMDDTELNPHYGYSDDSGRKHSVWFLDASTLFNQIKVADGFRPMGYAIWRMGGEDQLAWKLLNHDYGQARPQGLDVLEPGQDVNFDGNGRCCTSRTRRSPATAPWSSTPTPA
jgi:spore germination protein YaaH